MSLLGILPGLYFSENSFIFIFEEYFLLNIEFWVHSYCLSVFQLSYAFHSFYWEVCCLHPHSWCSFSGILKNFCLLISDLQWLCQGEFHCICYVWGLEWYLNLWLGFFCKFCKILVYYFSNNDSKQFLSPPILHVKSFYCVSYVSYNSFYFPFFVFFYSDMFYWPTFRQLTLFSCG